MQSFSQSKFSPFNLFKKHKKVTSYICVFLALCTLNLTTSCSYYKVKRLDTSTKSISDHVKAFNQQEKYVIINTPKNSWHLNNVVLNEDDMSLSGMLSYLSSEHITTNNRIEDKTYRYKRDEIQPLNDVHFNLILDLDASEGDLITIPFSNIKSISINQRNSGKAIVNVLGVTIGSLLFVAAIVALTKSSCPFVYIKDGDKYVFTGELYPGAITSNLQRDDYLQLPNFQSANNKYSLKITNELKEIQYTDMIELIVVEHAKEIEVLLDKNGIINTFSEIRSPINIILDNDIGPLQPAFKKDYDSYKFDSNIDDENTTRNLIMEFEKPTDALGGKLIITAKNSMWLDYVYGKFNEQFGDYFNQFQNDLEKDPAEKSIKWSNEQHIPLSVYLWTSDRWKFIDRITTVGPLAFRDIVIPIELSTIANDSRVKIKLESGFMFWEIDYLGIDFTENLPTQTSYLTPNCAYDKNQNDVTDLLRVTDEKYLTQREIGDEVIVTFMGNPNNTDLIQSVFLKNRGYYTYIREYSGKPDFDLLKGFNEKEAFTKFSIEKYRELIKAFDEDLVTSIE